jgi:osmotically-inducible protein OsmY
MVSALGYADFGVTDHELKDAIERELDWASDVDSDRVAVAVSDGAVVLSGQVLSFPEKAAATKAALRVRGVTALADEIIVRHAFDRVEDADIAREATVALRNTTVVPTDAVHATVHDHTVTLVGEVSWQHQRTAAAHAVGVLPGVIAVTNLIELKPLVPMVASEDAEANVIAALIRNAQLEAHHVDVAVSGTEVRLTGQVGSWSARHQAEYAAWCTPGVTYVDDQLVIVPKSSTGTSPTRCE